MKIIKSIEQMREYSSALRCSQKDTRIGFIPTMGYLHEGHLSLVRKSKKSCDVTVVSIFVNPIQFNDPKDLEKYPRDETHDLALLEKEDVDIVFLPQAGEVYPDGSVEIFIDYPRITPKLCGLTRSGHFSGVLTIVHNLFQWVQPHTAFFGQKDYQQQLLIKRMTADLSMNVDILMCPIVRERDGLAMSSRNVRLSPEGRRNSANIFQALEITRNTWLNEPGLTAGTLQEILMNTLESNNIEIEYAGFYHIQTLNELKADEFFNSALCALAVHIDGVRLIDNMLFKK